MKAAALFAVLLCVIDTTSSQPTYDSRQQRVCDDDCQQQDDKLEILQRQFSVMKNEIAQLQQLKNQVDDFLYAIGGGNLRPGVNDNGTTPGVLPRSASKSEHTVIKFNIDLPVT